MSSKKETAVNADETAAALLLDLIRKELASVPIDKWGYFFPCHLGVWRFLELKRPGVLGTLEAGYDQEPYFRGKGSEWFCGTLGNRDEYLDLLEQIMYPLAASLSPTIRERGFLVEAELPTIELDKIRRLAEVVLAEVDAALRSGAVR